MCLLTVIVPIYNSENTLHTCIDSIRNQTHTNLEILLMDDGSTDRSASICKQYALTDSRITYYPLPHGGVSTARKQGLYHANGQYVCFVDADDQVLPHAYEYMLQLLETSRADIGCFGYYTVAQSEITPVVPQTADSLSSSAALSLLFTDDGVGGFLWNKIYRLDILSPDLFDSTLEYCEDLYFNAMLLNNVKLSVVFLQKALYHYCIAGNSVTQSKSFFKKDRTFCYKPAFQKILKEIKVSPKDDLYYIIQNKYSKILEYSMYTLITAQVRSKTDIRLMKRAMCKNLYHAVLHSSASTREKIHYLVLTVMPRIYAAIKF